MDLLRKVTSQLRGPQREERCYFTLQDVGSWLLLHDDFPGGKAIGDTQLDPQIRIHSRFPVEIWRQIVNDLVTPCFAGDQDGTGRVQLANNKIRMSVLTGLACASKLHRRIVLEFWAETFNVFWYSDSSQLNRMAELNEVEILHFVRRLVCGDQYQIYKAPEHAFRPFRSIEELVFNGHSDIDFGASFTFQGNSASQVTMPQALMWQNNDDGIPQQEEHPAPRMAYRRLTVIFPSTLHTLRVYNGHTPDIYLIHKAARECPRLRTLTLGRCTIFTMSDCKFWSSLPRSESDAYFNNRQVVEYATAVGKELARLPMLETVQIGVYLTEHAAIRTHIQEHAGINAAEEMSLLDWKRPCEKCVLEYQGPTSLVQQEATTILARLIPSLNRVSWLSFCSTERTEWDSQHVLRDSDGGFKGLVSH